MKTRILPGWLFGILLAAAAAASGFSQNVLNTTPKASSSDPAAAATSAANTSAAPQYSSATPAAPAKPSDPSQPPRISVSPWTHEIQKLVQAGVQERVITSYITNSAGMFNLTADQIIYLKTAGVSPRVLSVMLQHDQQLFSSAGLMPPPAAAPAGLLATFATPGGSPVLANDESPALEPVFPDDSYYAPEQPEDIGPVRARYAVKLNDPIIMLRVPTLTVPCW
jgi:hypothetical protein